MADLYSLSSSWKPNDKIGLESGPIAAFRRQLSSIIERKYASRVDKIITLTRDNTMYAELSLNAAGQLIIEWSEFKQTNACRELFWYLQDPENYGFFRRFEFIHLNREFTQEQATAELIKKIEHIDLNAVDKKIVYFKDLNSAPTKYWYESVLCQNAGRYRRSLPAIDCNQQDADAFLKWQEKNGAILMYLLMGAHDQDNSVVHIEGFHVFNMDDLPIEGDYLLCIGSFPGEPRKETKVTIANSNDLYCRISAAAQQENLAPDAFCFMWIAPHTTAPA